MPTTETRKWRFKGPEMEGAVARWYARLRSTNSQIEVCRKQASRLTAGLPYGADVLEVAPGPGYLAIEMARSGRFHVTGLDISHTFVEIAGRNAQEEGVSVDFRRGDVAGMPFADGSFDLIACQAAFKNFTLPLKALAEMHRVLRVGGIAVIQDMCRDASHADIEDEVKRMEVGRVSAFTTMATLEMLKRRAYSTAQFERLVSDSPFHTCQIAADGIGIEVRLHKEETK